MMARNTNVPFKGRIQKSKTHDLQIITFGLQRAAGPYRWARIDRTTRRSQLMPPTLRCHSLANCQMMRQP